MSIIVDDVIRFIRRDMFAARTPRVALHKMSSEEEGMKAGLKLALGMLVKQEDEAG